MVYFRYINKYIFRLYCVYVKKRNRWRVVLEDVKFYIQCQQPIVILMKIQIFRK